MMEQGPIRPPSEAASLLVRVTRGCAWNRCAFCPVYKGLPFSVRAPEDVVRDIQEARASEQTVFLQDADALGVKVESLLTILHALGERLPQVRRITSYGRSRTLARRSVGDLIRLRQAGLGRVHIGVESGSAAVLERVSKGARPEHHLRALEGLAEAGVETCAYIMPGLGGQGLSAKHTDDTVALLRAAPPTHLRLRSLAVVPGSPMGRLQAEGKHVPLDEEGVVVEIRRLVEGLAGAPIVLVSDHILNLLERVGGDLRHEGPVLLARIDAFLGLPSRERELYILARRMGLARGPEDLARPGVYRAAREARRRILAQGLTVREAVASFARGMV